MCVMVGWQAQDRSLRDAASAAAAQRSPGTPVGLKKQSTTSESARRKGTGIDRVFLQRIAKLLPILVPGPFCKEAFYLALVRPLGPLPLPCDPNPTNLPEETRARSLGACR